MKWEELTLAEETFSDIYIRDGVIARDYVLKPESLVPYQIYTLLKERFGAPNSSMFDDTKSQWQYSLQCNDAYFEVYDWKMSTWSIGVFLKEGVKRKAEDIADELHCLFEKQAGRLAGKLKSKIKESKACVIENPYLMYRTTADSLFVLAQEMKEVTVTGAGNINFHQWGQHYDVCRAAFIMYLSSVEAFVNLIYELYIRDELREKRIYERIVREQIDLKIRLAPAYCECFKKGVLDSETDVFRRFHSLVNLRNNFVHANFTKPMMTPLIHEDGIDFVLPSDSETLIGIPNHFGSLESNDVEIACNITQELIDYMVGEMRPRYKKEILYFMELEHIEVTYAQERLNVAMR